MNNFWSNNSDTILVGVITAIIVLILSEPIKTGLKSLGGWLETNFQAFGFGFQGKYFRALIASHQWLKLIGVYNSSDLYPPRLQEVYVALKVSSSKESPRSSWEQIFEISNGKHIVILGQPGSGKSTLLDYLVLILTGHINHPLTTYIGKLIPIFVRLRDAGKNKGTDSILTLIESPKNSGLNYYPKGFFKRNLQNGKCVVLLDGLDEVLDEALHEKIVNDIVTFSNEYPDNWIIVTCRTAGWKDQLRNFRRYEIQEFEGDDIRKFIGAWYREVIRTEEINRLGINPSESLIRETEANSYRKSLDQADSLFGIIQGNDSLVRMARTPLILSLITLVHKIRTDLPKGRSRLYRECLEIMLEKWDIQDKRLDLIKSPSLKDKLFVLQHISMYFLENDLLQLDQRKLENLIAPLIPSLTAQIPEDILLRQLYERSGVFVELSLGHFGFAHRALQDYLAASFIANNDLDSILLKHVKEERWREVILMAIGLVSPQQRSMALIQALIDQGYRDTMSLALAGYSLSEDIQIDEKLRIEVKERLLDAIQSPKEDIYFVHLRNALIETDYLAFGKWMEKSLLSTDDHLRERAFQSISGLKAEMTGHFIPIFLKIINDSHADNELRIQSTLALVNLSFKPDQSIWNSLNNLRQNQNLDLRYAATWVLCELGRYSDFGMVKVPSGEFIMGSDNSDDTSNADEQPQHTVYLPTFYIGQFPVTVADYKNYIQDDSSKASVLEDLPDNQPVTNITWKDAIEYANWFGVSLPSEAEWEKSARGNDGRYYPWGNSWHPNYANTSEYWHGGRGALSKMIRRTSNANITAVDVFARLNVSPYKCADMVGNVWEWTRSTYFKYPYITSDGREIIDISQRFVLRGGSFEENHQNARCSSRLAIGMNFPAKNRGFRIAISSNF